jgi:O-acetyl-ADP-ribose deacetylase
MTEAAMEKRFGNLAIELVRGDITRQDDLDVVVNAANAELRPGGGVAGAIHRAAGPALEKECRALAPIRSGQAVITGGHGLPNSHVIHCLGPVYGVDEPSEALLAACYRRALELAEQQGLTSIGLPALSTGVFGYPMRDAAVVAIGSIVAAAPHLESVRLVRFILFDDEALQVHREVLEGLG